MLQKLKTLQQILESGIIAVIRADEPSQALKIAEAVREGGIIAIEITMTVPGAIKVIEELYSTYKNKEILVGAGTVLDAETARAAILAGACFVVSPHFNPDVVRLCHRYQVVAIPGAMTIRDVVEALESGVDLIKLFPGSFFGPEAVSAIRGPLPQAAICPTGGVSLQNVSEWIKAGSACVGVGGDLTKGAKTGDYQAVTDIARNYIQKIRDARSSLLLGN